MDHASRPRISRAQAAIRRARARAAEELQGTKYAQGVYLQYAHDRLTPPPTFNYPLFLALRYWSPR